MPPSSLQSGDDAHPEGNLQAEEPSFEEAYTRLGKTVRALESGELTLEAATSLYEEGMLLVQLCNRRLSEAELRMTRLRDAHATEAVDEPLFPDEE
jgi:exodeoxyribonuclease VII small subunit